ncbi:hypothetical protein ABFS83_03G106700 [Erythranthe nasuta]
MRMNQKHKNDPKNKALQNLLFKMLQQKDEAKAKRALITLCDLHRRKVWFEDRLQMLMTMIAALSFLLDFEKTMAMRVTILVNMSQQPHNLK